jgi:uncharacterized surface protein with fasciclin (FAS1) repeats
MRHFCLMCGVQVPDLYQLAIGMGFGAGMQQMAEAGLTRLLQSAEPATLLVVDTQSGVDAGGDYFNTSAHVCTPTVAAAAATRNQTLSRHLLRGNASIAAGGAFMPDSGGGSAVRAYTARENLNNTFVHSTMGIYVDAAELTQASAVRTINGNIWMIAEALRLPAPTLLDLLREHSVAVDGGGADATVQQWLQWVMLDSALAAELGKSGPYTIFAPSGEHVPQSI